MCISRVLILPSLWMHQTVHTEYKINNNIFRSSGYNNSYRLVIPYCYYLEKSFTLFSFRLLFRLWQTNPQCISFVIILLRICVGLSRHSNQLNQLMNLIQKRLFFLTRALTFTVFVTHASYVFFDSIIWYFWVKYLSDCEYLIPTGLIMAQVPTLPYYY